MIGYVHSLLHPHQTIHTPAQYIHVAIASEFSKIGQEMPSQSKNDSFIADSTSVVLNY